jgi:hypothetical protein
MRCRCEKPVFFIGMPRSGTTMLFELVVRNDLFAWPSNFTERWPTVPALNVWRRLLENSLFNLPGKKDEYGGRRKINKLRVRPSESYDFWDTISGADFARSYLLDTEPDERSIRAMRHAVEAIQYWQGKPRFAAKFTGPGRVRFLTKAFPDALFVHVVRDGRAVVRSLLNVAFWREKGGLNRPFWTGGLTRDDLNELAAAGNDPLILAALQWRRVVETTERELSLLTDSRYITVKYEEVVKAADQVLAKLFDFFAIDVDPEHLTKQLADGGLANMNYKYHQGFSEPRIEQMTSVMQPTLSSHGYF